MKVRVPNIGLINFPDTMTDAEVKAVLKQFEPKKDDTIPKLLASIEKLVKNQKPQVITDTKVQVVEIPKIVERTQIQTIDREVKAEPMSWHFTFERDESGITNVWAEPYE